MTVSFVAVASVLLFLFPLGGAVVNAVIGPRGGRRFVNVIGVGSILGAFVVSLFVLLTMVGAPEGGKAVTAHLWDWLALGHGQLSVGVDVTLDPLSAVMLMVITGVGLLIHVYSVGYMEHEKDIARFFSSMNFFVFSMIVLVLAANFVVLIVGWALVALSSYLLIGFWYQRPSAVIAARKAFITQVIGDVALVIAAFLIVVNVGTLSLPMIFAHASSFPIGGQTITAICLLLAVGAFAKSAQFPLHTWLPDAMEGPTPVSALIHAATMVTAGVYLICRFHPLFDRAPVAQGVVALVGLGTALMAGVIALSQIDIKRVIAYSTMSQIGLMIYATGIGAYSAGMYHLVTHAIFKALLFMAAGNVIHALHDEQDIRLMGGVGARMRATELAFLSGSLALSGFPLFAGWFSKESILGLGMTNGPGLPIALYFVAVGLNVLTGLYAFRLWAVVFRGEPQTARVHAAHEARNIMLVPVLILAALSAIAGLVLGWPVAGIHVLGDFLAPVFSTASSGAVAVEPNTIVGVIGLLVGTVGSLAGIGIAVRLWLQRRPDAQAVASRLPVLLPQLSLHKFYFDELYNVAFTKPITAVARSTRRVIEPVVMLRWTDAITAFFGDLSLSFREWQNGLVRDYATMMLGAIALLVVVVAIWGVR